MPTSKRKPPPTRHVFSSKDDEIEYLWEKLRYWFWNLGKRRARHYAERLANLLGKPPKNDVPVNRFQHWILIWEARDNIQEAIRIADLDLAWERDWLAGWKRSDHKKPAFLDDVRGLEEVLYLQADRHLRANDRVNARERMLEAAALATRFGVPLDEQEQELLQELNHRA